MNSVALCTYNGAPFIEAQIRSILEQTLPVDEIVICDDGSTDGTPDLILWLKGTLPGGEKIQLHRNTRNLGFCSNFEQAMNLCSGDLIFLSDQDDVWYPHKVQTIVSWFEQHPDKTTVFTNGDLIDSTGKIIPSKRLWDIFAFGKEEQRLFNKGYAFEVFAYNNRATGATMAMRNCRPYQFASLCSPLIYHDYYLAVQSILKKQFGYITQPLIQYRIHPHQASNPSITNNSHTHMDIWAIDWNKEEFYRLFVNDTEEFCRQRSQFLQQRNIIYWHTFGFLLALIHHSNYRRIYPNAWHRYMAYDIQASLHHMRHRLARKFTLTTKKR